MSTQHDRETLSIPDLGTDADGIPILAAYTDADVFRVWCQQCQRWHGHGAIGGHRVAHCGTGAYPRGYMLRQVGPWTPEMEGLQCKARRRRRDDGNR